MRTCLVSVAFAPLIARDLGAQLALLAVMGTGRQGRSQLTFFPAGPKTLAWSKSTYYGTLGIFLSVLSAGRVCRRRRG